MDDVFDDQQKQYKDIILITDGGDHDSFAEEARDYCTRLAQGPTRAFGAAKRLIALSPESSLETQMEHERRAIAESAGTEEAQT